MAQPPTPECEDEMSTEVTTTATITGTAPVYWGVVTGPDEAERQEDRDGRERGARDRG